MRSFSRRSILGALGAALPFGLGAGLGAARGEAAPAPRLRFRPFEDAVREAFSARGPSDDGTCHRIEVGDSDLIRAGVQGCYNDRPFAGFPAGHLRIVRSGSGPGPTHQGVRLYISAVDVALTGGPTREDRGRPLDFGSLPPAPIFG